MIITSKWIIKNVALFDDYFDGMDFRKLEEAKHYNSREIAKNTLSTSKDIPKGIYILEEVFIKE